MIESPLETTPGGQRPDPPDFTTDFERASIGLRGALTELLASVSVDPSSPQDMARRFGLNKNLTWKVARIVNDPDPYATALHIPGVAGCRILLSALEQGGADDGALERVRNALAEFDRMVDLHAGSRGSLQLVLASMRPSSLSPTHREASRRAAFEGNSAIWGVQARSRLVVGMVHPSQKGDDLIDIATLGGFFDFRRLRSDVSWHLTRFELHGEGNEDGARESLIEPEVGEDGIPFLRPFCSETLPEMRRVPLKEGYSCELTEGPVGNTAAFSCVFGSIVRGVGPVELGPGGELGEHAVRLDVPVEWFVLDLLLHRDLSDVDVEAVLTSGIQGPQPFPLSENRAKFMPLTEDVQELGAFPPVLASPQIRQHPELIRYACDRLDWNLDEFRGWRLVLRYPPIPTFPCFRYGPRGTFSRRT
jgi:hypothetical protein